MSMIFSSLDSSHQDDLNGSKIMSIGAILMELWNFKGMYLIIYIFNVIF
jgi:hypothetical protein